MLIGNVFLVFIAICMAALVGAAIVGAYFAYKTWKDGQPKPAIIEIEGFHQDKTQGYGLIINGKIILRDDMKPLLFDKEHIAREILREKYHDQGEVVYQKWDLKTNQLKIGKVIKRGSTEHSENQSHARKSS